MGKLFKDRGAKFVAAKIKQKPAHKARKKIVVLLASANKTY